MSLLDRISPWQRSQARRTSQAAESRATREALAASIAGLARAMEERFVSIAERIDGVREAQATDAERVAGVLGDRLDAALGELRAMLDARLDRMASDVAAMRDGQDFARVLRELKRDLGAQISLSSFDVAEEIRAAAALDRAARPPAASGAASPPA